MVERPAEWLVESDFSRRHGGCDPGLEQVLDPDALIAQEPIDLFDGVRRSLCAAITVAHDKELTPFARLRNAGSVRLENLWFRIWGTSGRRLFSAQFGSFRGAWKATDKRRLSQARVFKESMIGL
jgi:hypothetical protein